jgi:hypothetical protein
MRGHLLRRTAATVALVTTCLVAAATSASAADGPGVTVGARHATNENTPVALTGVAISDGGIGLLRVTITVEDGAGTLSLGTVAGLSFDTGDGTDDALLEFRGAAADLNAALATLQFTPAPAFRGRANITVSVTDGALVFGEHYYEYVDAHGITWDDARTAASARSYYGRQGYLATITSAEENAFAAAKLGGEGWIGARAEIIADRQHWRWVTGPEATSPDAVGAGVDRGLPFYFGADMTQTCAVQPDQATVGGRYSNWLANEPNNCEDEFVAHFVLPSGTWNDYAPDNGNIDGYVVEYGGLESDQPVAPPTATATILVRAGVLAPDAPTAAEASVANDAVTISWLAPVDDGGSPITGYTVSTGPGDQCRRHGTGVDPGDRDDPRPSGERRARRGE